MPNMMADQPNIGGALCESSVIPFLVARRKFWLTPTAQVPCSNAAKIEERKTWMQTELCTCQNSVRGPRKCIHSVSAQETAKHRARYGWLPLSDVTAVRKPRHETRWNLLGCPKLPKRSLSLVGWSFFLIVDICLSCEDTANKVVWWCRDGDFVHHFWILYFQWAVCSTFQTCILNSH